MKLKYPKALLSTLLLSLSFNLFADVDVNWDFKEISISGKPLEGARPSIAVGRLADRRIGQSAPVIILYRDHPSNKGGSIWAVTSVVYGDNSWRQSIEPLFKGDTALNPSVVPIGVDKDGNPQVVATYEIYGPSPSNPAKIMAGIGTILPGSNLVWSNFSLVGEGEWNHSDAAIAAIGVDRFGNQEVLAVYRKGNDTLLAKIGTVDKIKNTISWRKADDFYDAIGKHYVNGYNLDAAYLGTDDKGNRLVLITHSYSVRAPDYAWAEIGTIDKYTGALHMKYSENYFNEKVSAAGYTKITVLGKDRAGNQQVIVGDKIGTIDTRAPRLDKYAQIKWKDHGYVTPGVLAGFDKIGNPLLFGVTTGLNANFTTDDKLYFGIGKVTNE